MLRTLRGDTPPWPDIHLSATGSPCAHAPAGLLGAGQKKVFSDHPISGKSPEHPRTIEGYWPVARSASSRRSTAHPPRTLRRQPAPQTAALTAKPSSAATARSLWEASLAISEALGDRSVTASQLVGLAGIKFSIDDGTALATAIEALQVATEAGNVDITVFALDTIAICAAAEAPDQAVRLAGAAASLRDALGGGPTLEAVGLPTARHQVSALLSPDVVEAEWQAGTEMSLDQASEFAHRLVDGVNCAAHP